MSSPQSRGSSLSSSLRGETGASDEVGVVRHEEEASVRREEVEVGAVRARKNVETERVEQSVPRHVERVDELERAAANEGDSGEIEVLPDGSVSIPILEEELVGKRTETEQQVVEADLRKERVEVEADEGVELRSDKLDSPS